MWFEVGSWLFLLVYGVILGGMNFFFYFLLKMVLLGIVVVLEFIGLLVVVMLFLCCLVDFIWVGLVILGFWFLLFLGSSIGSIDLFGVVCVLGVGVCWVFYIILG